jgi:hypothetical protein
MISGETLKAVLQTVYDLGREIGNTESWQPETIDLDDYEDDDTVTLTNSTLKNAMQESADTAKEMILERLRVARHDCSSFYADGLEHAIDIISGKLD